ncbi:MAG: PHP domain-containing protein [Candidatus Tectomicrobia bacterium]|nr:PHP domain-containing protein [Candidatus Tectomicrobia bacterium]
MAWFKGNTHSHTINSDGDSAPEVVVNWYKSRGYDFLVLSDHNFLTPIDPLKDLTGSDFLLINGEEISAVFEGHPIHINGLNLSEVVFPQTGASLIDTIQRNIEAIRKAGGIPHINHPNYKWAFNHEHLMGVTDYKFIEVYNGHPRVNNLGGGGHPSSEEVWDHLLSAGHQIYGIASDDAHHLQGEFSRDRANPGRGWVMVNTEALSPGMILEAIEKGDFYASTGVILKNCAITREEVRVEIEVMGDTKYTTFFIGYQGEILKRCVEPIALYKPRGDERYVRTKVIGSNSELAWIQPLFLM